MTIGTSNLHDAADCAKHPTTRMAPIKTLSRTWTRATSVPGKLRCVGVTTPGLARCRCGGN